MHFSTRIFLVAAIHAALLAASILPLLTPLKPSEDYTHSAIVDEYDEQQFQFFWKLLNKDEIQFELHCRSTGWVGFGLSPNGGMTGADIAIGWVDNAGKAHLKDTHATGFRTPLIDAKQDWQLIQATQTNGYTIIKMKRQLNTCDKEEDIEIKEETNYLIFAWNNEDPVTGNGDWAYHGPDNRLNKVDFLLNFKEQSLLDDDVDVDPAYTYQYTLNQVPILKKDTMYFCQIIELPQYTETVHMFKYDVIVEKENRDLVHHLVIYECPPTGKIDLVSVEERGKECGEVKVPDYIAECNSGPMVVAWAIGGDRKFSFPKNTGLPLYNSTQKKYYLLEYHYDNPKLADNRKDSSGIRFYFTPKLRQHELGIMTLGTDTLPLDLFIPPKMDSIMFTSSCHPECTQKFLPNDGITLISGFLHTHLAGRSVKTKLVRNNKVVSYLFDNPKYDFNYQFGILIEPFKLQKGDRLITECTYESKNRTEPTLWGHGTKEEMCFNYVYHYPKMHNFRTCYTKASPKSTVAFFNNLMKDGLFPSMEFTEANYWQSYETIVNILMHDIVYTDELRTRFKNFYTNAGGTELQICGSYDAESEAIFDLEKPFVPPVDDLANLVVDKCKNSGIKSLSIIGNGDLVKLFFIFISAISSIGLFSF